MKSYRDLFKSTAWYYARYRPGYPRPFLNHIIEKFQCDGTGRLLDLGCGTGQLAIPLASSFDEVVGMDPEPEMIAEAKIQAGTVGVNDIKWVEAGSEDLTEQLGPFKLVTMGSSFHWMNREATLITLDKMVVPDGGIVVGGTLSISNQSNEWKDGLKAVIQRWLGKERRAGSSTYTHPKERHEAIIARSPFGRIETYELEYKRQWNIETLIGHLYSTSFCSLEVLGDKHKPFEKDLQETLLNFNPDGQFIEDVLLEAFLAWRV